MRFNRKSLSKIIQTNSTLIRTHKDFLEVVISVQFVWNSTISVRLMLLQVSIESFITARVRSTREGNVFNLFTSREEGGGTGIPLDRT